MSTSTSTRTGMATVRSVAALVPHVVWKALRLTGRWWGYVTLLVLFSGLVHFISHDDTLAWGLVALGWWLPALAGGTCIVRRPDLWERYVEGPLRRSSWRRYIKREWGFLARTSGWTEARPGGDGKTVHVAPRLKDITVKGDVITLRVRTRAGQTVDELEAGVPRLAATMNAVSHSSRAPASGISGLIITLVMRDALAATQYASGPPLLNEPIGSGVPVGRTITGDPFNLQVLGLHTLVVGAAGSGKGSWLWSTTCGLASGISDGRVQMWGIDLKSGLEIAMGEGLFSAHAYNPESAVVVLRRLVEVMHQRGAQMRGQSRLHTPTVGDPLHVLVIDELAALTAYAPKEIKAEAAELLGLLLTQGRALGISVVAFVQDPRKEVVPARGLFTQTVALRLRSTAEVTMVLGEGMAERAPADKIARAYPGTGYLVDETGHVVKVRATWWPDQWVEYVGRNYRSRVHVDVTPPKEPTKPAEPSKPSQGRDTPQRAHDEMGASHSEDCQPDTAGPTARARRRQPKQPRSKRPTHEAG